MFEKLPNGYDSSDSDYNVKKSKRSSSPEHRKLARKDKRKSKEDANLSEESDSRGKIQIKQNIIIKPPNGYENMDEDIDEANQLIFGEKCNLADLSDSEELYLLQVPTNIRPKSLKKLRINLDDETRLEIDEENYIVTPVGALRDPVLVVGNHPNILHIQSTLNIKRHVEKPSDKKKNNLFIQTHSNVPMPEQLKTRHPLFGREYKNKIYLDEAIEQKLELTMANVEKRHKKTKRKSKDKSEEFSNNEVIFDLLNNSNKVKKDHDDFSQYNYNFSQSIKNEDDDDENEVGQKQSDDDDDGETFFDNLLKNKKRDSSPTKATKSPKQIKKQQVKYELDDSPPESAKPIQFKTEKGDVQKKKSSINQIDDEMDLSLKRMKKTPAQKKRQSNESSKSVGIKSERVAEEENQLNYSVKKKNSSIKHAPEHKKHELPTRMKPELSEDEMDSSLNRTKETPKQKKHQSNDSFKSIKSERVEEEENQFSNSFKKKKSSIKQKEEALKQRKQETDDEMDSSLELPMRMRPELSEDEMDSSVKRTKETPKQKKHQPSNSSKSIKSERVEEEENQVNNFNEKKSSIKQKEERRKQKKQETDDEMDSSPELPMRKRPELSEDEIYSSQKRMKQTPKQKKHQSNNSSKSIKSERVEEEENHVNNSFNKKKSSIKQKEETDDEMDSSPELPTRMRPELSEDEMNSSQKRMKETPKQKKHQTNDSSKSIRIKSERIEEEENEFNNSFNKKKSSIKQKEEETDDEMDTYPELPMGMKPELSEEEDDNIFDNFIKAKKRKNDLPKSTTPKRKKYENDTDNDSSSNEFVKPVLKKKSIINSTLLPEMCSSPKFNPELSRISPEKKKSKKFNKNHSDSGLVQIKQENDDDVNNAEKLRQILKQLAGQSISKKSDRFKSESDFANEIFKKMCKKSSNVDD